MKVVFIIFLLFVLCCKTGPTYGALTPTQTPTMRPTSITASSDPRVVAFTFQAGTGSLFITFDQLIVPSSLVSSKMTIQGSRNRTKSGNVALFYTPFNNLNDLGNTTTLTFVPSIDDFGRVTSLPDVAISIGTTYLTLGRGAIKSASSWADNQEINTTYAFQATTFVADKNPPEFRAFSLDVNKCILNMTFNEPINPASFQLSGIAIQSQDNIFRSGIIVKFQNAGSSILNVWNYQRNISVSLGQDNCDLIKSQDGLAGDYEETYLSLYAPFVNDTSSNPINIIGVDIYSAKKPEKYIADTTNPKLLKWVLDFGSNCLALYFDEAMKGASLNVSRVYLLNGPSYAASTMIINIQTPSSSTLDNRAIITICLSVDQGNYVKLSPVIANSIDDTYIIIEPNAICDNSNNENWYKGLDGTRNKTKQAFAFYPDLKPPDILSWYIDLTNKNVSFVFDEPCILDRIVFSGLSFQSKKVADASTEIVPMDNTTAVKVTTGNSTTFQMKLTNAGFNALKSGTKLARSKDSIFLTNSILFTADTSGNPVVAHSSASGIGPASFLPDIKSPELISWSIDMTLNEITFDFTEPVNITTFNASAITISSDAIPVASSTNVTLNILSTVAYIPSSASSSVKLTLNSTDVVVIKSTNVLCSVNTSCWLTFTRFLCTDTLTISASGQAYANNIIPLANLKVNNFTPDRLGPRITSFSVDLNKGQLNFVFDKPINTDKVFVNGTLLSTSPVDFISNATSLSAYNDIIVSNFIYVTVGFLQSDLNNLKERGICFSNSTCFATLASNYSFFDVYSNSFAGFVDTSGKRVSVLGVKSVTSDTSPPALTAFFYDRLSVSLALYFSESVLQSSFDAGTFNFINSVGTSVAFGKAVQVMIPNSNLITLNIQSVISAMAGAVVGESQDTTIAYMKANGVQDLSKLGSKNLGTSVTTAIREGNSILYFRLNLAVNYLTFEFAAPLDLASLDITKVSLTTASGSVQLTGYSKYSLLTSTLLRVYLTSNDYLSIQTNLNIGSKDDIRALVLATFILDSKKRQLSSMKSLPCTLFISENIPPYLVDYDLNLGTGILDFYFSEAVVVAGISLNYVFLTNANSTSAITLSLKGAKIITQLARTKYVSVSLNEGGYPTLRDRIHLSSGSLGRSTLTTYVYFSPSFAYDTALPPNFVVGISSDGAKKVRTLVADKIVPTLLMYRIDLLSRKIYLEFDEAVNATKNDPNSYVLGQSTNDASSTRYTLASSTTVVSESSGTLVTIAISTADYIAIMKLAPNLCLTIQTCYLSLKAGAIFDIAATANPIKDIFYRYGMYPATFARDSSGPNLVNFDFSLQDGWFDLYYDKVVNCNTFNVTKFTFQYALFTSSFTEKLTLDENCAASCLIQYNTSFRVNIGSTTLLKIKIFDFLLKNPSFSYLVVAQGGILDPFGNKQSPINDGFALKVRKYYGDTVKPRFLSYTILAQRTLVLTFNEPMNVSSAMITKVAFQDKRTAGYYEYNLTQASLFLGIDAYKRVLTYSINDDFSKIIQNSRVFSEQAKTFLRLSSAMIRDTSGNSVENILPADAIPLGPSLASWGIDMNSGYFTLYFSEDVLPPYLKVSSSIFVRLQNSQIYGNGTNYVNLNTSQQMTRDTSTYNSSQFVIKLSTYDINVLKYNRVAYSVASSYLSVAFGLTQSLYSGTIIPFLKTIEIPTSKALLVNAFVADTTRPVCSSYDLNLNTGRLILIFTEPVLSSSIALASLSLLSTKGATAKISEVQRQVTLFNLTNIVISVNTYDLNLIKIATKEAALSNLLIGEGAAEDYFGNKMIGNNEKNPVGRREFTADTTPPTVTGFQLDLQKGMITLDFSEVIDLSKFSLSNTKILSADNNAAIPSITMTRYSLLTLKSDFSVEIDMSSYNKDIAALKSQSGIGTSTSNTYFSCASVYDIFGNFDAATQRIRASSIITDNVKPVLLSFDFESSNSDYEISLYFTKALEVSSFSCASFTFSSSGSASSFTPGHGDCSPSTTGTYSEKITFKILKSKFNSTIGTSADNNTWIQVTSSQTNKNKDVYGNLLSNNPNIYKRVGPQITKYFVDMNLGTIVLVFSKPVVLSSNFNASKLSLYSTLTKVQTYLTGASYSSMNKIFPDPPDPSPDLDYFGKIVLSATDLDNLKISDLKADSFFLALSLGLAKDSFSKDVNVIAPQSMMKAVQFVPDVTRPNLLKMTIDMGLEKILLQFDEPIRASSVKVTLLVIQSKVNTSANSIKLVNANVQTSGRNLTIYMISSDAGAIKVKAGLAKDISSAFLSFGFQAMADFGGNFLSTQSSTAAFAATNFLPDNTSPVIVSFDVDMNVGNIKFTFSEPVLARTFNPRSIVVQSRFLSKDGTYFAITGGKVSATDGFIVTLTLLDSDFTAIRNTIGLCRTRQSAYIVISSDLVVDTNFNNITAITDGKALPCNYLAADVIPPTVKSVAFDVNKNQITFYMSELIQLPSVDVTKLALVGGSNASTSLKYTLTTSSRVASYTHPYTSSLVVVVGAWDLNSIKSLSPLITSAAMSWYRVLKPFVQDTFGNFLASDILLPTDIYYPDVTNPLITDITIDMTSLVVTLYVSEAIDMKRLTTTEYFIHNNNIKRYGNSSTLAGSIFESGKGGDSNIILVMLSSENSKYMKYNFICQTAKTCLHSWSNEFAYDYAGNYLPAHWDASITGYEPIVPVFKSDALEPVLLKWFFDRTKLQFNLFFDEPVRLQNRSQIVIYFDIKMTPTTKVVLKNVEASYLDYNSHVILEFPKVCRASVSSDCNGDQNSLMLLTSSPAKSLYITTAATAFSDFALIPNNLKDKSAIPFQESGPECGPCPTGSYVSQQCTNNADRVCTLCSSCSSGKFALSQCSAYTDTQCELCSTCSDGYYISQQCTATSDARCDVCTKCDSLSYETRHCEYGLNTICASCKSCKLSGAKAIAVCGAGKYFSWALSNCCFDSSGQPQICSMVTMADMYVSTVAGRHQWVFPKTVPPVVGFGMGVDF